MPALRTRTRVIPPAARPTHASPAVTAHQRVWRTRTSALPAWAFATAGAVVYLLLDPPSADLAAQEYRASAARRAG